MQEPRIITDQWEFDGWLPETVQESISHYGELETLYLIQTALKEKEQNIARKLFQDGVSEAIVNKAVRTYRPGKRRGGKGYTKDRVFKLLTEKSQQLQDNEEAMSEIKVAIGRGKWKKARELLEGV